MKLFSRYNRINIPVTIVIFIVGSVMFYFLLQRILVHQLDETLRSEMQEIRSYVESHHQLPEIQNTRGQWTTIDSADTPPARIVLKHNNWFDQREKEDEPIRQIIFAQRVNDRTFTITV